MYGMLSCRPHRFEDNTPVRRPKDGCRSSHKVDGDSSAHDPQLVSSSFCWIHHGYQRVNLLRSSVCFVCVDSTCRSSRYFRYTQRSARNIPGIDLC